MASTPAEEDVYRVDNIYVAEPESDLQSTPLPPPPPVTNAGYAEINDVRGQDAQGQESRPKIRVLERNDLENGGSKVKVMVSRGKGSSVGYVLPDEVRGQRSAEWSNERQKYANVNDGKEGEDVVKSVYLSMDGSPKNKAKNAGNQIEVQQSCDDEIAGYERPISPVKSRPIRALHYDTPPSGDTNQPMRVQDGNDVIPHANEAQVAGYDVPKPEPIYAEIPEIPENIYEDLDDHQAGMMRESTA